MQLLGEYDVIPVCIVIFGGSLTKLSMSVKRKIRQIKESLHSVKIKIDNLKVVECPKKYFPKKYFTIFLDKFVYALFSFSLLLQFQ